MSNILRIPQYVIANIFAIAEEKVPKQFRKAFSSTSAIESAFNYTVRSDVVVFFFKTSPEGEYSGRSVKLSVLTDVENTLTVVFERVVNEASSVTELKTVTTSFTRHYQDVSWLKESKLFATVPTRLSRQNLEDDIVQFLLYDKTPPTHFTEADLKAVLI